MKKIMAVLLALSMILSLTGCGIESVIAGPSTMVVRIAMEESSTEAEREGMRIFADKFTQNSASELKVKLYFTGSPIADLKNGDADIIYDSCANLAKYESDFLIYDSPFFFRDYEHMTMTLNSPNFISMTEDDYRESLGAYELGVAYGGAKMFISEGDGIRTVADFKNHVVGIEDTPYMKQVFAKYSKKIEVLDDDTDYTFEGKSADTMEINSSLLSKISTEHADEIYLTQSFHQIESKWILASADFTDKLGIVDNAAMHEAAAYTVASIDKSTKKAFEDALQSLLGFGMQSSRLATDSLRLECRDFVTSCEIPELKIDAERYEMVSAIIR